MSEQARESKELNKTFEQLKQERDGALEEQQKAKREMQLMQVSLNT